MLIAEKSKTTPTLPGVRQGKSVLALLLLGMLWNIGTALQSGIAEWLFIPPFIALTLPLMVLLPYLWLPLYWRWRKNIEQTWWRSLINITIILLLCSSCWLVYRQTLLLRTTIQCEPQTEAGVYRCEMSIPVGARTVERVSFYQQMGFLPVMTLIWQPEA
jgi:hypothetical protein